MVIEAPLYLAAPVVGIAYTVFEHLGVWDKLTGRHHAIRLRSGGGYPESVIYDLNEDQKEFKALLKRIKKIVKKTSVDANNQLLAQTDKPGIITTGGLPILIQGLPPGWPQKSKCFYSDNYPVLLEFCSPKRGVIATGKTIRVCSLKDIDDWIKNEKENRKVYVGTLVVGILAVALIIVRLMIHKKT